MACLDILIRLQHLISHGYIPTFTVQRCLGLGAVSDNLH